MKKTLTVLATTLVLIILLAPQIRAQSDRDTLFQVSTINGLLDGLYDGVTPVSVLKMHGDIGLGTFDGLDGEMVVSQGRVFQVRADGKAYAVKDDVTTPFAAVTFFDPDLSLELGQIDSMDQLKQVLGKNLPGRNLFHAIRLTGDFEYIKTRSVPKQEKPYPPLAEVTKHQPTFEFSNPKGVIVGFYCPDFVQKINVTGFHLHFLTEDKQAGGHLLEIRGKNIRAEVDPTESFHMILPESEAAQKVDFSRDKKEELERVEK